MSKSSHKRIETLLRDENARLRTALDRERAQYAALEGILADVRKLAKKGVADITVLIAESDGVYGLHLNGDPCPWDHILEGGYMEEWLANFEALRRAVEVE